MNIMNGEMVIDDPFQRSLLSLVLESVSPWIDQKSQNAQISNWVVAQISNRNEQLLVTVRSVLNGQQYTALICLLGAPEVVAVSHTDNLLQQLNPYLDGGQKLETELDSPRCWKIFNVCIKAQKGARSLRYLRGGVAFEVEANSFGCFEIVDWNSTQPIEAFLEIKIDDVWQETIVSALPYTVDYLVRCWKKAVDGRMCRNNRWNHWMTAAFVELGGPDRAVLEQALMDAFVSMPDEYYLRTFKQERRKFLKNEQSPLMKVLQAA